MFEANSTLHFDVMNSQLNEFVLDEDLRSSEFHFTNHIPFFCTVKFQYADYIFVDFACNQVISFQNHLIVVMILFKDIIYCSNVHFVIIYSKNDDLTTDNAIEDICTVFDSGDISMNRVFNDTAP